MNDQLLLIMIISIMMPTNSQVAITKSTTRISIFHLNMLTILTHTCIAMTMMTYQSDYGYSTPPSQHGRVLGECGVRREIALGCRKYLAPCLAISYPCHHQLHLLLPKFINRIEGQFLEMQSLEEVEDHCYRGSIKTCSESSGICYSYVSSLEEDKPPSIVGTLYGMV